jgi:IclR family acetate operon transcriptional repressor
MELMGGELTGRRSGHRSKRPPGIREASVATPTGTQAAGRPAGTQVAGRATGTRPADQAPTGTQAVDRAARLVTEVVHAPDSVTFTELAAATGLAKSTTSRLLVALERGGLIRRDDDGRFRPGDVFVRYAWRGGAEAGLIEVARPFLDRLGGQTGETVNLGVARDGLVEQVAQVDSTYLIGGTNWVGRPVPLHCAALGKVLLAYGAAQLPPGRLEARTSQTLTSRAALEDNLRQVRRCGYAVTDGELEPGLVAVAAPVYRDGAVVVGALSVSAPASRLSPQRIPAVAAQCVAQALALSEVLGHRAPAGPGTSPGTSPAPRERARHPGNEPGPDPRQTTPQRQREGAS